MPALRRSWQAVAVGLLVSGSALALVAAPGLGAQGRAVVVLSTTLERPLLTWIVARLTAAPEAEEIVVAGAPATLARPGGEGPWPALVVVNGATPLGREEPAVRRLALGLARAGYLVLVPDLPGVRDGAVTEATLAAAVAVAGATAARPDARGGRVGLVGISVGTSLALLAAQDPRLAGRVSLVTGTAPYADLANVLRLAATGYYREGNLLIRYETDPFLAVAAARSAVASLPPGPDRERLLAVADRLDGDGPDPLAPLRELGDEDLGPEARAARELVVNRDPLRFDELYAALPAEARATIARLSPLTGAERLDMPVELATGPADKYFPPAESHALARRALDARVTVSATLDHAEPVPSLRELGDLLRFNGWVVRSLALASD